MAECEDQSRVIAFLSAPATFGSVEPVERIDTHAAVIFLCGDRAWKLKRAVRFPYLDFSTPEKRKAVCEAELALNRRTAPEIYLGITFVGRRPDGSLALGEGRPIDWLVMMRRFEQSMLLDRMASEGKLDSSMLRTLADVIADFHAGAEMVFGSGAQRVRNVIEGNRDAMAALPRGLLDERDGGRLYDESLIRAEALAQLLDQRAKDGCVRHCHGDLHLANICMWHGRPTLFDCLEFSPELATTDVLYDIAFLVMDLCRRGLRGEASLVLNRYCDMRSECAGLAALPLFLSMRAAVRAHVQASAADRQPGEAGRREHSAAARSYLSAALAFLDPKTPRLIAVGGLSGTGKSTLAARLAPRVAAPPGARWLRTDVLRKRMEGVAPEQPLPAESYTASRSAAVYARLIAETEIVLAAGMSVIVDGVFAAPAEREAVAGLARRVGVPFRGIWLEAPPSVMRQRVDARRNDASDANVMVVEQQLSYDVGDLADWSRIDSSGTIEDVARRALDAVDGPVS